MLVYVNIILCIKYIYIIYIIVSYLLFDIIKNRYIYHYNYIYIDQAVARAPAHAHKPNRMELDLRVIPFLRVLIISCVRVAYQSQVQLPRFCGLSNSIGGFQPIPKYIVN